MGMTLTEKILARHAGLDRVEPGRIINARVDLVLANELSAAVAIGVMRGIKGAAALDSSQDRQQLRGRYVRNWGSSNPRENIALE